MSTVNSMGKVLQKMAKGKQTTVGIGKCESEWVVAINYYMAHGWEPTKQLYLGPFETSLYTGCCLAISSICMFSW